MGRVSIHRALSELKIIDKKIEAKLDSFEPCGLMQVEKLVNTTTKKTDFDQSANSSFQSIQDLIERKSTIKSAIVKANGETKVNISSIEMTIADAINFKSTIPMRMKLVSKLENSYSRVLAAVSANNNKINEHAIAIAKAALQKDSVAIGDQDAVQITEPYIHKNQYHLVDPLKALDKSREIKQKLLDFQAEVDAVLSEANAITLIEI